ncbi:MAG TPA: WecB/TagA/CpsF family glycosyltransferase [Bryobacteraceae bacterium]|nr:WecB/TagA/CpsF family glycosyltransferase [Bryobacteraceae bacterium]
MLYPSADRSAIAGVGFDLIGARPVLETICGWRNSRTRNYICLVNPHSVMLCHRDPEMKAAVRRAGLVLPDGAGVVLGAALMNSRHNGRLAGPDLMLYLCDEGRRYGLTHYFFGGTAGTAERLAQRLARRYPGLSIAGCFTPPFRKVSAHAHARMIEQINLRRPDILWVGLGAPKQEKWMAEHANVVEATAMIGVGAAFDFHSGNIRRCPALLRNAGLEWAYRLSCEPGRLWRRNLDSPLFLGLVAYEMLRSRLMFWKDSSGAGVRSRGSLDPDHDARPRSQSENTAANLDSMHKLEREAG